MHFFVSISKHLILLPKFSDRYLFSSNFTQIYIIFWFCFFFVKKHNNFRKKNINLKKGGWKCFFVFLCPRKMEIIHRSFSIHKIFFQ